MAWVPDVEKKLKICLFVLTEYKNLMDRRQTLHDGIGRTYA